ncbi:MAG: hypothetical protein IJD97_10065 [Clostridia bacterium]|nr:hypothetical protein [Clostridia bacterium]
MDKYTFLSDTIITLSNKADIELSEIYQMPVDELMKTEKTALFTFQSKVVKEAGVAIRNVIKESGIPYPETLWRTILEDLPTPSFTHINWDNVDLKKLNLQCQSAESFQLKHLDKGLPIIIASAAVAVGSVILISIMPSGNPLKKLLIPVVVVAVLAGGFVAVKKLFSKKTSELGTFPSSSNQKASPETEITMVENKNHEALKVWFANLESLTISVIKGE